ncbi:hypothetical protein Tco_1327306 [Tanacetum coccineum]
MYTFPPMMVANSRKHHCRVRPYTREVLVFSTNLEIQTKHCSLDFTNRRGNEARIKKTSVPEGMSRSVPERMSRSVLEGMSRSVLEGMSRPVPKGMSRSILEGMSRSVLEGMSRSVPEGMSRSVPS